MMGIEEIIWGVIGFLFTIMILSYLIGDNVFFRFAAHAFIGLTAGYLAVVIIQYILWPYLFTPLSTASWQTWLWMIIPLSLIILLILGQTPRFAGLGRYPLAFLAGLTAAVMLGGAVFGTLVPQAQSVISGYDPSRFYISSDLLWLRILEAVVMIIGIIGTLSYFHFGRKRKPVDDEASTQRPGIFKVLSKIGQVFIGITLGAVFAGIFSSALTALIDRILFIGQFIAQFIGGI